MRSALRRVLSRFDTTNVVLANTAGATLDLNGNNQQVRWITGGGTTGGVITNTGGTTKALTLNLLNSGAQTYSGAINGDLQLVVQNATTKNSDSQALAAVNSYTGGTVVDAGTLALHSTISDQSVIRGSLTVNPGASVAISGIDYAGLGRTGGANVTDLRPAQSSFHQACAPGAASAEKKANRASR